MAYFIHLSLNVCFCFCCWYNSVCYVEINKVFSPGVQFFSFQIEYIQKYQEVNIVNVQSYVQTYIYQSVDLLFTFSRQLTETVTYINSQWTACIYLIKWNNTILNIQVKSKWTIIFRSYSPQNINVRMPKLDELVMI